MGKDQKRKNQKRTDLLKLKNLGAASVNILHAVGINSYEDLQKVGAANAYKLIKSRNIHVSKVMLYALQGALLNTHWNDLDSNLKIKLLKDVDETSQ